MAWHLGILGGFLDKKKPDKYEIIGSIVTVSRTAIIFCPPL
jgi:drug/metabolite transporter superfamily protein YnfA